MRKVIEKGRRDFGRPPKLSRADQLLMTLMYWREYRTEFHIAQSYGISESAVLGVPKSLSKIRVYEMSEVRKSNAATQNWKD